MGIHDQTDACNTKRMDGCVWLPLSVFDPALWPRDNVFTRTTAYNAAHRKGSNHTRFSNAAVVCLVKVQSPYCRCRQCHTVLVPISLPSVQHFSSFSFYRSLLRFVYSFAPSVLVHPCSSFHSSFPPIFFPLSWCVHPSVLSVLIPLTTFCASTFSLHPL